MESVPNEANIRRIKVQRVLHNGQIHLRALIGGGVMIRANVLNPATIPRLAQRVRESVGFGPEISFVWFEV